MPARGGGSGTFYNLLSYSYSDAFSPTTDIPRQRHRQRRLLSEWVIDSVANETAHEFMDEWMPLHHSRRHRLKQQ